MMNGPLLTRAAAMAGRANPAAPLPASTLRKTRGEQKANTRFAEGLFMVG
jgi:hypothetical protein